MEIFSERAGAGQMGIGKNQPFSLPGGAVGGTLANGEAVARSLSGLPLSLISNGCSSQNLKGDSRHFPLFVFNCCSRT